jgi:putative transposase
VDVKTLHAKIGELTLANDFLEHALGQSRSGAERKAMIDRSMPLPLTRQAETRDQPGQPLLSPAACPRQADLALMRRMDELHLEYPFAGSRMLRDLCGARASRSGVCSVPR